MSEILKAVRYRNLDEARAVLAEVFQGREVPDPFNDSGEEPQGLLSVIPEDRLGEEDFIRLFGVKKGVLVEVERCRYSGFGPPSEEEDYMGFAAEQAAYVMKGRRYEIDVHNCPVGALDIHQLESLIDEGLHPFNAEDFANRLGLEEGWTFEDLFDLIGAGELTGEEVDRAIHLGFQ